jgi:hypothetical protein
MGPGGDFEGVGMGFETVKVDESNVRISEKKNIVRGNDLYSLQ